MRTWVCVLWCTALVALACARVHASEEEVRLAFVPAGEAYGLPDRDAVIASKAEQRRLASRMGHTSDSMRRNMERAMADKRTNPHVPWSANEAWAEELRAALGVESPRMENSVDGNATYYCDNSVHVITDESGVFVLDGATAHAHLGCTALLRPASGRCLNITVHPHIVMKPKEMLVISDGSGVGPMYTFSKDVWGWRGPPAPVLTSASVAVINFNTLDTLYPLPYHRSWRVEFHAVDECLPCSAYECMACQALEHCDVCADTGVCSPAGTCGAGGVQPLMSDCPHFLDEATALREIAFADYTSVLGWDVFTYKPLSDMSPLVWCDMTGVRCSPNLRVVGLRMDDVPFTMSQGVLDMLTRLSALEDVEVARCALAGSLPDAIGDLPLHVLSIYDSELTGTIPASLANAPLLHIMLRRNVLTGTLPAALFRSDTLLLADFSENLLEGGMPLLDEATTLHVFAVESNLLGGTFPRALRAPALRALHASSNNFVSGLPEELPGNLHRLALNQNRLFGTLPAAWPEQAPSIYEIYLDGNALYGTLPASWNRFTSLAHLEVGHNALYGTLPDWSALRLITLTLEDNFLVGELSRSVLNERMLDLYAGLNFFTGSLPAFDKLCPHLYALHLGGNHLTGTIPDGLLAMEMLTELALHTNAGLSGSLPELRAPRLKDFSIAQTNVSGVIHTSYFNHSLLYLDAHATAVTAIGDVPSDTKLTVLDVSSAQLKDHIPTQVFHIAHVDLSGNALRQEMYIDDSRKSFYRITSLAVARCQLHGAVPHLYMLPQLNLFDGRFNTFGSWDYAESASHVATLLLGYNLIHKSPDKWKTFSQLRSPTMAELFPDLVQLDLSENRFSPVPLPVSWGRLSKLQSLNIVNSGMRASPDDARILGFDCGQGALSGMCWPRYLNISHTSVASADGEQLCYELEYVRDRHMFTKVLIGDDYYHGLNCLCAAGRYYDTVSGTCVGCMAHAVCPGGQQGLVRAAMPGYYGSPSPEHPSGMVRCKLRGVCAPLIDGEVNLNVSQPCVVGRTGRLCARCAAGYFKLGESCARCGSKSTRWIVPTVFAVMLAAFVGYLYVARNNSAGLLKVTLFYLQVLKLLPAMGAPLPSYLLGSTESSSALSVHLSGVECLFPGYDEETKFYVAALTPPILVCLVAAIYTVGLFFKRTRAHPAVWRAINFRVALCLLFAAYLLVVTTVFGALPCEMDPFSRRWFFNNAPDIACGDSVTGSPAFRKLAIVAVFTHVLGLPLFFGVALWRQRRARFRKLVALKYGFLYEGYRLRVWWWELVILARRIIIALIVSLQDNDSAVLPMFVLFALLMSLLLQRHYLPYTTPLDNALETASLMVLIVSYATVIAFFDDQLRYKDLLAIMIIFINVCVTLMLLAALARRRMSFLSRWVKRAETSMLVNLHHGSLRDLGAESGMGDSLLEMHVPLDVAVPAMDDRQLGSVE